MFRSNPMTPNNGEKNMCDGCKKGFPLVNGWHDNGKEEYKWDSCTNFWGQKVPPSSEETKEKICACRNKLTDKNVKHLLNRCVWEAGNVQVLETPRVTEIVGGRPVSSPTPETGLPEGIREEWEERFYMCGLNGIYGCDGEENYDISENIKSFIFTEISAAYARGRADEIKRNIERNER